MEKEEKQRLLLPQQDGRDKTNKLEKENNNED
jgi:hypothetical protein